MSQIFIQSFFVLLGFVIMIIGADRLVKGAVGIAYKLNLSKAFVGAVLVGFGTSAPELFTSLFSASRGEGILAAGNVIGSNVFNSTLVMAACLLFPFSLHKKEKNLVNLSMLLAPGLLMFYFLLDLKLSRTEGFLLLIPLFALFYFLLKGKSEEAEEEAISGLSISCIWILIGITGLYIGSKTAIESSLKVSELLGISKSFAGAIILAAGTGLPELVTTVIAGYKKELSLAFANILGSNSLNAFGVLGAAGVIYPFEVTAQMAHKNGAFLILISFMLLPIFIIKSRMFHKAWALLLIVLYALFMTQN